jgi:hypothetical protein
MASTYTTNLGIEKPATGDRSGTWGTMTNTNFDLVDEAVNGVLEKTLSATGSSGSPNTLAITDGSSSDGRNQSIDFKDAGDIGGTVYVQLTPNDAEKVCHVRNSLSGSRSILLFQGTYNSSRDLELENGKDYLVKFSGGGASASTVTNLLTNVAVSSLTNAGTYTGGGLMTTGGNVVIPDGGNIGSASDTDAIAVASGGNVTLTQNLIVAADITAGDDLILDSDAAAIQFGDGQDVTLTHVADTGLLLNGTMQLQFNDASQNINAPSATVLDINATDEVEINATLADVNANLDVSGTYTGGGTMTTGGNIVIPNAGNIGSASDTDAIAIASSGDVTLSQDLTVTGAASFGSVSSLGTLSSLTVSGAATFNGDVTLGNAAGDDITVGGDFVSHLTPNTDSTYNLGSSSLYWSKLYADSIYTTGKVYFGTASTIGVSLGSSLLFTGGGTEYGYGARAGSTSATYFYSVVNTSGGHEGGIYMTSGTVSLQNVSDYRLKENISTLTGAIDKVKALNPVRFKRNDYEDAVMQDGFLAHEVQAVVPEAVVGEKDAVKADGSIEPQSMQAASLIPVLTSALKEALAKIEVLETKVAALEAK